MAVDELKSEVTQSKPRDESGQFLNVPKIKPSDGPITQFIKSHTGNYKNQDDLLDIKVGNPLGRIVALLEDIKKQKAFSFTLKGSLGLAGVVLVLSVFGLFGGGKIICDKGVQSQIGTIKVLEAREIYSRQIPVLSYLLELVAPPQKQIKRRTVIVKNDQSTIYLPFSEIIDFSKYDEQGVIATGTFNSCSQTLTITEQDDLQAYSP